MNPEEEEALYILEDGTETAEAPRHRGREMTLATRRISPDRPASTSIDLPEIEIEGELRGSDTEADVVNSRLRKGNAATVNDAGPAARRRDLTIGVGEALGLDTLPRRLREVPIIGDTLGDWAESGTSSGTGAVSGATMGFADELSGAAAAGGAALEGEDPGEAYTATRDRVRETAERDRASSPVAFGAGELTGALATAPLTPGFARGGLGLGERLAAGVIEGGGYGALAGAGYSDATGEELARDTIEGGLGGAAVGGVASGLAEAGRAGLGGMRRVADAADRLRVVAPAGGNAAAADELLSLPGAGAPGSAERTRSIADRMRRIGLGGVATSEEMADRAATARRRAGEELAATRGVLESGPAIPTSAITGAMERHAADLGRTSSGVPFADTVRARIPRVSEAMGGAESVPYSRAMEELEGIGSEANWTNRAGVEVRPSTEARRGLYGAVREAMDDFARPTLGDDGLEAYRRSRHDYATARAAREAADAASTRTARNRGMSPTDYAVALGAGSAGYAGAGATGGLTAAATGLGMSAAHRAARLREPTLRATGAEAVRALLESRGARALGEYGPAMMSALERGGEAFAGRHAALMRTDPEYATAVESAMTDEETADRPMTARDLFEAGLETEAPPRRSARELFEAGLE